MRVITVRQPWAGSIIWHGKSPENRSRNIAGSYRGPVAIHVSLKHDYSAVEAHEAVFGGMDQHNTCGYGAVIGVVDLVDVHTDGECYNDSLHEVARLYREDRPAFAALPDSGAGGVVGKVRHCSPWAMEDHHHLVMENARPLATPIPAKGRLGLWTPDADLLAAIREQVPDVAR